MMLLLHLVSYVGALFAFLFVTLSLASGLLYIAEVIEEHSRAAKLVGQRLIFGVMAAHVLFCIVDRLPWHLCLLGIFCHGIYLQNFSRTWPFISLTSISFLSSCVLVIIDHFAWFFYFADRAKEHPHHYRGQRTPYRSAWDAPRSRAHEPLSFMDVATFFGFCVWLVPFFLFLSLSANDNVLPSVDGGLPSTPQIKAPGGQAVSYTSMPRTSIMKAVLEPIVGLVPGRFFGHRGSRSQRDGLIASPQRSAPPSPTGIYPSPGAGWAAPFTPPPPPLSPSALGGSMAGLSAPGTPSLSPKVSYNAFRDAANSRHAHLAGIPQPRRSNTSPTFTNRLGTPQHEDMFVAMPRAPSPLSSAAISATDGIDGMAAAAPPAGQVAYAGSQQMMPAGMTKRKVG